MPRPFDPDYRIPAALPDDEAAHWHPADRRVLGLNLGEWMRRAKVPALILGALAAAWLAWCVPDHLQVR